MGFNGLIDCWVSSSEFPILFIEGMLLQIGLSIIFLKVVISIGLRNSSVHRL
jgi:hypothetical protein